MSRFLSGTFALAGLLLLATPAFADDTAPMTVAGATTVECTQAKGLYDAGVPFVDVRNSSDWDGGRIAGAVHIDSKKMTEAKLLEVTKTKDAKVVFYCNGPKCLRSSEVAVLAVGWGFTGVQYMREGLPGWKAAGYPVE